MKKYKVFWIEICSAYANADSLEEAEEAALTKYINPACDEQIFERSEEVDSEPQEACGL